MDVAYGPWFSALTHLSGTPLLMQRVVAALGVPAGGKGLQVTSALALRAVGTVADRSSLLADWRSGFAELSKHCSMLQVEYPALRNLGRVDPAESRAYAALVRIAARGTIVSSAALQALGCELLCAAGSSRVADGGTLDLIAALANSGRALQAGSDWLALEALQPFSEEGLRSAMDEHRLKGQAQLLARRLARLFRALTRPVALPIEGQKPIRGVQGTGQSSGPPADGPKQPKPVKKHKPRPPAEPPSFARLAASAVHLTALDHLGVPEVWHRYRLPELQPVTRRLAADINAAASPDCAKLAAFCLVALLINHDHRATAKLSLIDNDDLWMSLEARVLSIKVNNRRRKRKRKAQGSPPSAALKERRNLVHIALPKCLSDYLAHMQTGAPSAATLGVLLGIGDADAWARRCESYLAPLGDPAHPARPGRVSHSLGLAYLELGASPELAAALALAPCLCADSSLDYMCFELCDAKQMSERVYEALGLGPAADTRDYGRMGSSRALTDIEVRAVWTRLEDLYRVAMSNIDHAADIKAVADGYTGGSAAAYLAMTWCVAGRGQRPDRPTHADVRTHLRLVYWDDKETEPTGKRLIERLPLLNTVVAAQLALSTAAARALRRLGVPLNAIPAALSEPMPSDLLFGRLALNGAASEIEWGLLSGADVASAVAACGCKHRNAARHTWASAVQAAGTGLWAVRTLLGHGRGAATPGSLLGTWSPHDLLSDLGSRMSRVIARWGLQHFGGCDSAIEPLLLPLCVDLRTLDSEQQPTRRRGRPPLLRHLPRHYCWETSPQALRAIDELRAELHTAGEFGRAGAVLMSLVVMDGVLDPVDLRLIWDVLAVGSAEPVPELLWTRPTGQVIRRPLHPATQLLLGLALKPVPAKAVKKSVHETVLIEAPHCMSSQVKAEDQGPPTIDDAATKIAESLGNMFPQSCWPVTPAGILEALSWLMCQWARVHLPPLLLYCQDAHTKAATYTHASYRRITETFDLDQISPELLKRAVAPRSPRRPLAAELQQLMQIVGGVARDDRAIGDDLARSQQITAQLDERFDRAGCSALASFLLEWIDAELERWEQRRTDQLQMSSLAEYLRLVVRSVGNRIGELVPSQWTEHQWKRFATFVLDVHKPDEEGQVGAARAPGEIAERRQAWRRLVKVLNQAGQYPEAASAFLDRDVPAAPTRVARSASSTYCSSEHLSAAEVVLRQLLVHDPLEADLLMLQMRVGYECMGRSEECNALRLQDVGDDFLSLFGERLSTEKTEGSRRCPPISAEFAKSLKQVVAQLRALRPPPSYFFAERDGSFALRYGRDRQDLIELVMRAVLRDAQFIWHALRGIGLMLRLAPNTEAPVRAFLAGDQEIVHARTITAALRGPDPRHLGRVFGCSGHASQISPGQSYLPAWPIWYSAVMRAAGDHHTLSHQLLIDLGGAGFAATHRKRRQRACQMDEWSMALHRADRRAHRSRAAVAGVAAAPAVAALPSWLTALAHPEPIPWQTRLRFGIEVLFGLAEAPRAWRARIDGPTAAAVIAALQPLPTFSEIHRPRRRYLDDQARQRFSAADLLADDRCLQLLTALESATLPAVSALDDLLSDSLRAIEPELVELALSALPAAWKLELCWPRQGLDIRVLARLTRSKKRLEGLQRRVHVRGAIRARVVAATDPNHTVNTNMTTLARAACRVWLKLFNAGRT